MIQLGVAMDYHGGFSATGQHGRELVGAGQITKGWAIGIEADHRRKTCPYCQGSGIDPESYRCPSELPCPACAKPHP